MDIKTKLSVEVTRVNFKKPSGDEHWFILSTSAGTAKGKLSWEPMPGERLVLEGSWTVYQGTKEFRFDFAMPEVPEDARALLHYVSTFTPGVGDVLEKRIWETLGEDWIEIKVGEVEGMNSQKVLALHQQLIVAREMAEQAQVFMFLSTHGCTEKMAKKAWKEWGRSAIANVNANPFKLADLERISFRDVDERVRPTFGIDLRDPRRIHAGILYSFAQASSDGSTTVKWQTLRENISKYLPYVPIEPDIFTVIQDMIKDGAMVGFHETQMITTGTLYNYEREIWDYAVSE